MKVHFHRCTTVLATMALSLVLCSPASAQGAGPLATYQGGSISPGDWLGYQGYLDWSERLGLEATHNA